MWWYTGKFSKQELFGERNLLVFNAGTKTLLISIQISPDSDREIGTNMNMKPTNILP